MPNSNRSAAATTTFSPNAEFIADALGGRRSSDGWVARCPAHEDRDPSFSIQEKDGTVLLHCFAGCSQNAVLAALRQQGLWTPPRAGGAADHHSHSTGAASASSTRSFPALWASYTPVSPSHSYLTKKRIRPHGARAVPGQSTLAIPLTDTAGTIHGLQFIAADGTKKFCYGSAVTGHFFLVGNQAADGDPLYIAEGFATAVTIHEVTGVQTAVAFNAGNLDAVTQALHRHWPRRRIVLCADDDARTGNPGLTNARRAAQAVGGTVASPNFGPHRPDGATDFNDLLVHCGPAAVADSIRNAQCAFPALENLIEKSSADPGYAFKPDVVAQLQALKGVDQSNYETLRAKLKQETACRVTQLDKTINTGNGHDSGGRVSTANQLVDRAGGELEDWTCLFLATQGGSPNEAFADLTINGRRETWPVGGIHFKHWLAVRHFEATGDTPSLEALRSAVNLIQSKAALMDRKHPVFIRSGVHDDRLYLDLCRDDWRVVEITTAGWQVIDSTECPVRFRRYPAMKQLPIPVQDGAIEALRSFVNIRSEDDFVLLVSWMLAALRNRGPYPLLVVSGEQGSAKSTVVSMVRSLMDPSHISTRIFPNEVVDLFIAAHHNYLLAFDNLSHLSNAASDVLCQLATGGGFGTRQLYTDQEELLISVSRPIILNGIENVAARPDLVDRSVFLTLEPIAETECRAESELWAHFETQRPRILGALLNAMVIGLNRLPDVQLPAQPRMADFAQWATACETAFWNAGQFIATYFTNRQEAMEDTVESDPVASSIRTLMTSVNQEWEGAASELLRALGDIAGERVVKSRRWPGSASALSRYLKRVAPPLRRVGVEISTLRRGKGRTRIVRITTISI